MTFMELGIATATGIAVGTPVTIVGVKKKSKIMAATGAAIIAAPIAWAVVGITTAHIEAKKFHQKKTSSDEA